MTQHVFNDYARVFAQFTTPYQQQAYELIAPMLTGRVLDAGAGCAKLAAFIPKHSKVSAYLGVDFSADMVNLGQRLLSQVSRTNYRLVEGRIEDVSGIYDTVVSIQSYYAWEDSASVLSHLYDCTAPGGTLVLATANEKLDIELLIRKCSRGWSMHKDWSVFVDYNRMLSNLPDGRYVTLDTLIGEIREAGFEVTDTDSSLYEKGVNLVTAKKTTGVDSSHTQTA